WKVPKYWPYAVSLSGQGQVVSATLIADVGNECLGVPGGREPDAPIGFPGDGGRQGCRSIQAQTHCRGRIGGSQSETSNWTSVPAFESTLPRRPNRSTVPTRPSLLTS